MSIENRNLKAGTKLVARYKGREHTAAVVRTDDGLRYRLEDRREFKSPSSAGSALMSGNPCNGWRFWSIAEAAPPKVKASSKARAKREKPDRPVPPTTEPAPEGDLKPD